MRLAAITILIALFSSTPFASAEVRWRSGPRAAPAPASPEALRATIAALAERSDSSRVVVHFAGPVDLAAREALGARGVRLLSYVGGHAYFATLEPGVDADAAASVEGLVAVEVIATHDKLHPDLIGGIVHPWTLVNASSDNEGLPAIAEGVPATDPEIAVYVLFHRDVDGEARAAEIVSRHGGTVRSHIRAVNGVVVHIRNSRVAALAGEDAVMWVEPPLPALTAINDSNRPRIGADVLQAAPYGLDGSGVTVLVYDSGQVFAHGDFAGRLTIGAGDTSGISDHSTHVAGTVGGDGTGSAGQYQGMAPAVDIVSYGFEQEGGLQQGFLYTDPGDLEDDYTEAINVYGVDLSNNSIGSNTAPNGFPCAWEGDYGVTAALIDEIVRGSIGAPFRIVWAAGNERQGSAPCGATYNTTAPPANAKNHITVGAMNSNDDSVTDFTSWGPSDDGRLRPDISGPGCQSNDDFGVTSTSSSGGYNVKCGTSMASPSVAGIAALLLQQYRLSFPGDPDFRNSTLKAILANTAEDLQNTGPDYQTNAQLAEETGLAVLASGGVASIDHIKELQTTGVEGVIVGRALYTGAVNLPEAVAAVA